MNNIDRLAERIYDETDFGRSVATSAAGVAGLVIYLVFYDWVIAAFASMIVFPLVRLIAAWLHEKANRVKKRLLIREEAEHTYDRLSDEEKDVVLGFVDAGGSVLTWSHVNELSMSGPAIESLLNRGVLSTSMTADGMRETFVLESAVFDAGLSQRGRAPKSISKRSDSIS